MRVATLQNQCKNILFSENTFPVHLAELGTAKQLMARLAFQMLKICGATCISDVVSSVANTLTIFFIASTSRSDM